MGKSVAPEKSPDPGTSFPVSGPSCLRSASKFRVESQLKSSVKLRIRESRIEQRVED